VGPFHNASAVNMIMAIVRGMARIAAPLEVVRRQAFPPWRLTRND
jgi:hypothetical protein